MKRIDWLQLIILPIAIAIMVVTWVEPWAHWVVLSTGIDRVGQVPSPAAMIALILVSTAVTREAIRRARYQRRLIVLSGLLAIIVVTALTYSVTQPAVLLRNLVDWQKSVAPELLTAIVVALLWWRGILIGRSRSLVEENLERTFLNGVLALAFLILVNHFSRRIAPPDMLAAVLIFFAVALTTLTIVNVELARAQQPEAGSWLKRQRHWFATILGVVGAILVGGLLLANFFSPDVLREFIASIGSAVSSVANVVTGVLRPLFTFFFWLISPLVPLLQAILRVLLEGIMGVLRVIQQLGLQLNAARAEKDIKSFLDSPEFVTFSRGTAVALLLILFALAAIWALRRSGLLSRRNPDETRESIASRELLIGQLKNLLNRLRRKQEIDRGLYLPLSGADPRRSVRQAYQEFLEWARIRNHAREPYQTPDLYTQRLSSWSAELRQPVSDLTALYLRARYAADELTPDEAQSAQAALVRLQETPVIQSPLNEE
jgi:Domain of unknown function (DUF4129)